ncbi:MAG: hypothetical protein AAGA77_17545 [Bacteroidota bacterium]
MNLFNEIPRIGQQLLDVPMGRMIKDMAFAIAEAQMRLDENSMEVAEMMGGLATIRDDATGEVTFRDSRVFFGQQKLTVEQAVTLYNNETDEYIKKDIVDSSKVDVTDGEASVKSGEEGKTIIIPQRLSMMELGFTPTFYQFVDTIIEVKISIKYAREGSYSRSVTTKQKKRSGGISFGFRRGLRARSGLRTSQVNATYSQKYTYSAEGSSLLKTKVVPIPPPAILEERIQQQMEIARSQAPS